MNSVKPSTRKEGEVRVTLDDLYSLLFSLNMNSDDSKNEKVSEQIEAIERIIAYNITRKDVPAYSYSRPSNFLKAMRRGILGGKNPIILS